MAKYNGKVLVTQTSEIHVVGIELPKQWVEGDVLESLKKQNYHDIIDEDRLYFNGVHKAELELDDE